MHEGIANESQGLGSNTSPRRVASTIQPGMNHLVANQTQIQTLAIPKQDHIIGMQPDAAFRFYR